MSYAAHRHSFGLHLPVTPCPVSAAPIPRPASILNRIRTALAASRAHDLDARMTAIIQRNGGHLSDSVEREMIASIVRRR